jgi:cytochrome c
MSRLKMLFVPLALSLGLRAGAADLDAGRAAFAQCMACHAADASNGTGPGLAGVVGRVSGTQPGFRYSRAMKAAKLQWDEKSLNAFLENPQKTVSGNLMPFSGVADAAERGALIAYLATLK